MSEENKSFKTARNTTQTGNGPMRRGGPPMAHPVEKAKDFKGADALRAELTAAGWSMLDGKDGYKLEPAKK